VVSLPLQLLVGVAWIAVFILTMNVVHLGMGPAVLLYALLYLIPKRVVAGSDGVRIGWLGPGKFVPYANVAHASLDDRGDVVIDLRNGARVRLLFRQPFRSSSTMNSFDLLTTLFARQKTAIVERIEEAARAHERGVADRDAGGVLARGGRTAVEWLKALHSLGSGAVNYRSVTLPPDVLWRIAENPAAPPHERAAAAVALRDALDEEGRARLRVLAEATAAPRVRVALEAAASATDDETLARALDECEGDTPEKRRHAGRAAG
jgi:hypothetical protein